MIRDKRLLGSPDEEREREKERERESWKVKEVSNESPSVASALNVWQ